jgi:hypothetical protein
MRFRAGTTIMDSGVEERAHPSALIAIIASATRPVLNNRFVVVIKVTLLALFKKIPPNLSCPDR